MSIRVVYAEDHRPFAAGVRPTSRSRFEHLSSALEVVGSTTSLDMRDAYREKEITLKLSWPEDVRILLHELKDNLFDEDLSVDRARHECGFLDKNTASRFRYYVGIGIKEFIVYHRIAAAKCILMKCDASISETAISVGYSNPGSFAKAFKSYEGTTPSEFRARFTG